jgi:hypothetical protein
MFTKAERKKIKLKIAITGPSGAGKTYSALRLAKGLGGKMALIDTENGSASLYSENFEFDTMELGPPFTSQKYIDAINAAVKAGYDVLIIDSITHQWKADGGILSRKEQVDARGGNSFSNWSKFTPEHDKFISVIAHSDIHIIATMRSKQEYSMGEGDKGKTKVQKLGTAPVQREGMEYEFTTVFDVAMNHEAETSKDRTGLFKGFFQVTERTGEVLRDWLAKATVQEAKKPTLTVPNETESTQGQWKPSEPQVKLLLAIGRKHGWAIDDFEPLKNLLATKFNIVSPSELKSSKDFQSTLTYLEQNPWTQKEYEKLPFEEEKTLGF